MQNGQLTPGEANRLQTLSCAVPLPSPGPESDSDDLPPSDLRDSNGSDTGTASGTDRSTNTSEGHEAQTTASDSSSGSDSGSDASAISGMNSSDGDSVAPTEVVEDEQDATVDLSKPKQPNNLGLLLSQRLPL